MQVEGSADTKARPMCTRCGRTFSALCNLRQHCKVMHTLTDCEMKCSLCRVELLSDRDYMNHALSAHSQIVLQNFEIKVVCGLCGCTMVSNTLWGHVRTVHLRLSDLSKECQVCAQVVGKKDLQTHYTEEHPSIPCYQCTLVFGSVWAYNKHFDSIHTNAEKVKKKASTKAIVCGLCSASFEYPNLLTKHIFSTHLRLVPKNSTVCVYCCQVLPFTDLTVHLNSLHPNIQCLLCGRNFSRNGYGIHLFSHFSS